MVTEKLVPKAEMPDYIGHRKRLREKFMREQLAEYEKLELALTYAVPRQDVRPVARALTKRFGSIYQILTASIEDLTSVKGMGLSSAICFKNMRDIMLTGFRGYFSENALYVDLEHFYDYCRLNVGCKNVEEVHVLYLDSRHFLLEDETHSAGTVDESAIYPREIVRRAITLEARVIVLLHNHPTPDMSFSKDDIKMTVELQALLNAIKITLYDHFVVSGDRVYSARNMRLLD